MVMVAFDYGRWVVGARVDVAPAAKRVNTFSPMFHTAHDTATRHAHTNGPAALGEGGRRDARPNGGGAIEFTCFWMRSPRPWPASPFEKPRGGSLRVWRCSTCRQVMQAS